MQHDFDRRATYALTILTFINLFNYIDRWIYSSVLESIKHSLGLSDASLGTIASGFIIVYAAASPVFGTLGDRAKRRPPLIALGVAIWSIATALAGFARGFWSLFLTRSTVGVGEAAYGTIAPALISDAFPLEKRGRVMSIFFMAIGVGSAAGYVIGGAIDQHFGWRAAFFAAGLPGLLLALLVLFVHDPPRGAQDHIATPVRKENVGETYRALFRNAPFLLTAIGYGFYTFALGGLGVWMPTFLQRVRGMTHSQATVTFGMITLFASFAGTFLGGWLGDFFLKRTKQSYLWVSGIATLVATPVTYVSLTNPNKPVYLTAIVFAEILIFMCTGPVNSAIVNAVVPSERATALGLSVLLMHFLGDVPSPPLIGYLSDRTSSLETGFLVVPVAVLLAGLVWCGTAMREARR